MHKVYHKQKHPLTMPTTSQRHNSSFASQRSNISALTALLARFSQDLERTIQETSGVCDNGTLFLFSFHVDVRPHRILQFFQPHCPFTTDCTIEEHRDIAVDFINLQHDRLIPIEQSLLQRTNDLLPLQDEQMTCNELARLLRDLQTKNVQIMEQLNDALGGYHYEQWNDCHLPPPSPVMVESRKSVLTPFSTIVETDYETDGTPASAFQSPTSSGTTYDNLTSPATPTLASLNLSTSTTHVLHLSESMDGEPRLSLDAIEAWRAKRSSLRNSISENIPKGSSGLSNPNQDDDADGQAEDMDAAITQKATTCAEHEIKTTTEFNYSDQQPMKNDNHFLSDDEESESRSHQTDNVEMDTSKIDSSALNAALRRLSIAPSESSMLRDDILEYSEDDGDTHEEERTCGTQPTIIQTERLRMAHLRGSLEGGDRSVVTFVDDVSMAGNTVIRTKPPPKKTMTDSPGAHSVREVVVNMNTSSPGPNNLTMDQSMFHETDTVASPSHSRIIAHHDMSSVTSLLVTPILDRYRLETDDSSVGIKVVPNERGIHRRKDLLGDNHKSRKPFVDSSNTHGISQTTKSYRKTPHPKQNRKPNLQPIIESLSPRLSSPSTHEASGQKNTTIGGRISIPALPLTTPATRSDRRKSESQMSRRCLSDEYDLSMAGPSMANSSTPGLTPTTSLSRTPLTAAWIAKHMPNDALMMDSIGMEEVSFTARELHHSLRNDTTMTPSAIELITMDEYKIAPRVVQMQVSLSEVNTAAEILSQWTVPKERVTESSAYELLPFPEKKSKSILMSLCHWRRMMMHLEANGERSFSFC